MPLQSAAPFEWDDHQFSSAVIEFNMNIHHPHPPGYPLYVMAGRALLPASRTPAAALTLFTAICAAISGPLIYWLFRRSFNPLQALSGAVLILVQPVYWFTSLRAVSDVPGLTFVLLTAAAATSKLKDRSAVIAVALLSAVALGIRPSNSLILAPLMLYFVVERSLWKKAGLFLTGLICFSAALATWLVPLILDTGDLKRFLELFAIQKEWAAEHDTVFAAFSAERLIRELRLAFVDIWGTKNFAIWMNLFIILGIGGFLFKEKKKNKIFFAAVFLPYLLYSYFFMNSFFMRYAVPAIPFLVLLFMWGLNFILGFSRFGKEKLIPFICAVTAAMFIIWSLPSFWEFHSEPPPVQKAFQWIMRNYKTENTVVLVNQSLRPHRDYLFSEDYRVKVVKAPFSRHNKEKVKNVLSVKQSGRRPKEAVPGYELLFEAMYEGKVMRRLSAGRYLWCGVYGMEDASETGADKPVETRLNHTPGPRTMK